MSKKNIRPTATPKAEPTQAVYEEVVAKATPTAKAVVAPSGSHEELPFGKSNYSIMLLGIALILAGFFIMTLDKEEFGFGFLGITLGPIVAFVGFMVEFYAILRKK